MRSIVWVGPTTILKENKAYLAHCYLEGGGPVRDVCVSETGGVYEFRGWRNIHVVEVDMLTMTAIEDSHDEWHVIRGHVIATADQLGGDEWMEWLRKEGLL